MKYLPEKILGWIGVCVNITLLALALETTFALHTDPALVVYPGEDPEDFLHEGIVAIIMTVVTTIASIVALFMFHESLLASGILLLLAGVFSGIHNPSTTVSVWILAGALAIVRHLIMNRIEKKRAMRKKAF